jgi:DNA-directed RNA polymerase subunit RPC12/RpoP
MKLIPCPNCGGKVAQGQPTLGFPEGAPVVMGRFTSIGPLVVKCFRCRRSFKLDVRTFHGLPEMTSDEWKSLGGQK